jgi:hypothetical protein
MGMTSRPRPASYRTLLTRGVMIAACGVLAAACGSTVAPTNSAKTSNTNSAGTTSAAKVSLDVVLQNGNGTPVSHWTLRCEPTGGTYPDAANACGKLLGYKNIFTPQPAHVMCPMIMADARSYIVYGTYLGKTVHETIVDGGCSITRWSELNQIFY